MTDPTNPITTPWSASPSAKAKNAVQRSVTALLDELAPERVLKRVEHLTGQVEQHRTPSGCVLQATDAAVTVSWFAEAATDAALGELHVVVWKGTVTRRGAPKSRKGASVVADLVLRPTEPSSDDCSWLAVDGTRYSTASLAAHVLALLEQQVSGQ